MIRNASFQSQQLIQQSEAIATSESCQPCPQKNTRCASVDRVELD